MIRVCHQLNVKCFYDKRLSTTPNPSLVRRGTEVVDFSSRLRLLSVVEIRRGWGLLSYKK
jgi:hypothetical protein